MAETAKYSLPIALYMLSSNLDSNQETMVWYLRCAWILVQILTFSLFVHINHGVGKLIDDGTVVKIEKPTSMFKRKKKGGKKKKITAAVVTTTLQQQQQQDEVATVPPATAPTPTSLSTTTTDTTTPPPPVLFEEMSIPAYDKREFSRLVTKQIVEVIFVSIFSFWMESKSAGGMGLIYGVISSPISLLENGLFLVHVLGHTHEPRPFGSSVAKPGVVQEMKEQWKDLKNLPETVLQDNRQEAKEELLLRRLQNRKK